MRVYILGPMRGKPYYNFAAFDLMADRLKHSGHESVNPADLDRKAGFNAYSLPDTYDWSQNPQGFNMEDAIARDLSAIMTCDAYVALSGWEKSAGARAEQALFHWRGCPRLDPENGFKVWREPIVALKAAVGDGVINGYKPYGGLTGGLCAPGLAAYILPSVTGPQVDDSNPKDKLGMKKTPFRLVPWVAICYLAKVMGLGAKKYGPFNWRDKKPRASVYYEAAIRHLLAALDGQDNDEESGLPHTAHAMACCAILIDAEKCNSLLDDRHKSGHVSEVMAFLTEKI